MQSRSKPCDETQWEEQEKTGLGRWIPRRAIWEENQPREVGKWKEELWDDLVCENTQPAPSVRM